VSEALSFSEITDLMGLTPRVPRYTLHAHPLAIELLKAVIGPSQEYTALDDLNRLVGGIDIYSEPAWTPGRYELRKDGEVTLEGTLP
jgi:hypothetical protein